MDHRYSDDYVFRIEDRNRIHMSDEDVAQYMGRQPEWDTLGYVTFKRTYARRLTGVQRTYRRDLGLRVGNESTEEFGESLRRVVEGDFSILRQQVRMSGQRWVESEAQTKMRHMFDLMWRGLFLPPGRGLGNMGADVVEKKGAACLNNCGMVSTKNIDQDFATPFTMLMDYSMLGVGMGFDLEGASKVLIQQPVQGLDAHVVADTREGWCAALHRVLCAFIGIGSLPGAWDTSLVRPEGSIIHTFGGTASGPGPLLELLGGAATILFGNVGHMITSTTIADVMNMIGRCVVAGNVRRSAEIALGLPTDREFLAIKDGTALNELLTKQQTVAEMNPEWREYEDVITGIQRRIQGISVLAPEVQEPLRHLATLQANQKTVIKRDEAWMALEAQIQAHPLRRYRWASNNTVLCGLDQDYTDLAHQTATNGEPGYGWMDIIRTRGRLRDPENTLDAKAVGFNPCQPAEALTLTPEGIRTFGDISVGSTIWSGRQWTKVTHKFPTGVKRVYRYRTTAGSFLGTADHRVVSNGTKTPVGEAGVIDLCRGPVAEGGPLDPQDVLDGILLGDGGWHGASNRNFLYQGVDDACYELSEVRPLLGEESVYSGKVLRRVISTITEPLPKTYLRRVPAPFLFGTFPKIRGFLRGLYSANGSVCGSRVTLKAASRGLIDDVQAMLSALGIGSYVTTNAEHPVEFDNGEYVCRESYDLNIGTAVGRERFSNLIGFIHPQKMVRLEAIELVKAGSKAAKVSFDIVSIEDLGEMPVFDITVEADEHTYWTNGLLVSNCAEQTLWDKELCCLVETFPTKHKDLAEFRDTLKYAYLHAKIVTCVPTHNSATNAVIARNRRIGTSMAGIWQMYETLGARECSRWWDEGYRHIRELDEDYSGWMGVGRSIKVTSVKPGGTIPLLVGVEGGMKLPISRFYMRTIRVESNSSLAQALIDAGYRVEPDLTTPRTVVAYFPCQDESTQRVAREVSLWEQAALFTRLQDDWSDNQVSATLTFQPHEAKDIPKVLGAHTGKWKAASFLPLWDHQYPQAPYIPCSEDEYLAAKAQIKPLVLEEGDLHDTDDKFCSSGVCELPVAQ